MARRFGRNQRRRAREALAAEHAAHASTSYQLAQERRHAAGLERQLDGIAELLGTNFLGLNEKLCQFEIPDHWTSFDAYSDINDTRHTMHILGVDSSPEWHRNAIHLRVRLANGEVAYSLSETSIHRAPAEYLARTLAGAMAPMLVREMRRRGIR